jgi:hypothetical protein
MAHHTRRVLDHPEPGMHPIDQRKGPFSQDDSQPGLVCRWHGMTVLLAPIPIHLCDGECLTGWACQDDIIPPFRFPSQDIGQDVRQEPGIEIKRCDGMPTVTERAGEPAETAEHIQDVHAVTRTRIIGRLMNQGWQ